MSAFDDNLEFTHVSGPKSYPHNAHGPISYRHIEDRSETLGYLWYSESPVMPAAGVIYCKALGDAAANASVYWHSQLRLGRALDLTPAECAELLQTKTPPKPEHGRLSSQVRRAENLITLERIANPPNHPPTWAERVEGTILGAAIGDAIGHPTEFLSMQQIVDAYGPHGVVGYELYWDTPHGRVAPYTDDTQMAEIVLRSLIRGRAPKSGLDPTMTDMAAGFISWASHPQGGHRSPGNACLAGAKALAKGIPWAEAGGATAGGCGSVMRAYPFGVILAHDLQLAQDWAVAHSKLTHRDPIALAACAAMAVGVGLALTGANVEQTCADMISAAARYSDSTAAMMTQAYQEAQEGVPPQRTLDRLRSWAAHEAISAAVYIFARHPDDVQSAILEGANTPGDSDSIATLAGALVGARVGSASLPAGWVQDLERRAELQRLAHQAARQTAIR